MPAACEAFGKAKYEASLCDMKRKLRFHVFFPEGKKMRSGGIGKANVIPGGSGCRSAGCGGAFSEGNFTRGNCNYCDH